MTKKAFARWRGYVFLSALVLFFAFNANVPPMGLDESMYMTASREMAASGDLLTPAYNGDPFFDKPPMTYWLQCASSAFFDVFFQEQRLWDARGALPADGRLFGMRAVSGVAGLLLLWLVMACGKTFFSPRAAVYAGFAFALSLLTCALGKMAITDMLLGLWCSASLFLFLLTYTRRLKKKYIVAAFASLGLALLTKGPIAAGIVGLPVLCFLAYRRDLRFMFDRYTAAGLLLMLAVAAPWYLLMQRAHGGFFYEFFMHQNLQRALGQDFAHNYNPFIYVGVILLGMAPWSLFLAPALIKYCRAKKTMLCEGFLSLWVISLFVMFTFINSRLPGYIFPVFPAAALLVGKYLEEYRPGRGAKAALVCSFALSVLLGGAVAAAPWFLEHQGLLVRCLAGLAGLWFAVFGAIALARRGGHPAPALVCQSLGFLLLLVCILPALGLDPDTLKDELDTKSDFLGTTGYIISRDFRPDDMPRDTAVISYGLHPLQVNFPFFAERKVYMPRTREELLALTEKEKYYFLVTDVKTQKREGLDSLPGRAVKDKRYAGSRNGLYIKIKN
ncbi:MAG: glycosyltransferase family 39 protein [Abditibacteriota bacterium]|nr:glycosyltransferase family 39 protein [Abditibacteriota bacterium]